MRKLLSLLLLSLASGQQMVNTSNTTNTSNSSASVLTSIVPRIVLNDKKVEVNVTVNKSDEEGTAGNPFDPPALLKIDDQSLSSFKYYFVILGISSLSVITVIIFKALR